MSTRFTVNLKSNDQKFALQQTNSLHHYLVKTCNPKDIQQVRKPLNENHAGGLLESILEMTLNSGSVLIIAKALHTWLRNRAQVIEAEKEELSLTMEFDGGKKITLTTKNIENIDVMIEKLTNLMNLKNGQNQPG